MPIIATDIELRYSGGAANSGAVTDLSGAMAFAANGGLAPPAEPSAHVMQTARGEALVLNLSAAVSVGGHHSYFLEA